MLNLNFFTRPRVKTNATGDAPFRFVHGDLLIPGAEVWSYVPTTASTPTYSPYVNRLYNFNTAPATQPPMDFQVLSLPPNPFMGNPFGNMHPDGLIAPTQYPNVKGQFYS